MSETATVETGAATGSQTTQGASFAGSGQAGASQATAASTAPQYLFADGFHKDGKFNEGWTEPFAEKYSALAGKLSQAKDHEGALSILNHMTKVASGRELKGAPNETWQPHEIAEYRRAFNVPEQASEYKFKPEKLAEGVHWPEGTEEFISQMHAKGVPADVMETIGTNLHQMLEGQTHHALGQFESQITEAQKAADAWAQQEWGNEAPERIEAWQAFVDTKFTKEQLASPSIKSALLIPEVIQAFEEQRQNLREGGMPGIQNSNGSGSMSPKQQGEALMREHPDYATNPTKTEIAKRIYQYFDLDAKQAKRR
jgi:hypothetical protein